MSTVFECYYYYFLCIITVFYDIFTVHQSYNKYVYIYVRIVENVYIQNIIRVLSRISAEPKHKSEEE